MGLTLRKFAILIISCLLALSSVHATCSVDNGFSTGEGSQPGTIWFTPNAKFAYVLLGALSKIITYRYNFNQGKLTRVPNSEIGSGGLSPTFGGSIDRNGKFMYVTNQDTNTIAVFSIDQTNGKLTQIQSISTVFHYPYVVALSPDGLYAYITVFESNKILLYKVDQQDGHLSPLITSRYPKGHIDTKAQPFVLSFSPSAKYAYLASYKENSIVRYSYNANNGELELDSSWSITTPLLSKPYALNFSPDGRYAYAPADERNKILQFINDNDQLRLNSPAEVATGGNPNTFIQFYVNGKFAYMGNYADSNIDLYRVQTNGTLVTNGQRMSTIAEPIVLRQPPDATHMFVVSRREACIADYDVNSHTGMLEPRYINTDITVNGNALKPRPA